MSKIETVWINNLTLKSEAQVPPSTVGHWEALGWAEGRRPSTEKAEERHARDVEKSAREAADGELAAERQMVALAIADGAELDAFGQPLDANKVASTADVKPLRAKNTTPGGASA